MKKYLVGVLVLTMLFTMATVAGAAGEVKIRHLEPGGEAKLGFAHEFANNYMEEHPNVEIEIIEVGWGNAYQKIMSMAQADDVPEVMYVGSRWIPVLAEMKAIKPLDSLLTEEKIDKYNPSVFKTAQYKNKQYGIPRAFSTKTLYYRTDLIDNPPETWDELVKVAKKVQKENPDMYGFGIAGAKHVSTTSQFFNYLFQAGGRVFNDQGEPVLNNEAGVKALQFYVDLYRKHKIVPNPIEYNREELPNLFATGKIAMYVCGPWGKSIIGRDPGNDKTPYQTAVLPKGKERKSILVSDSYVLGKDAGKEAWEYLKYLTSFETQTYYDYNYGSVPMMKLAAKLPKFKKSDFFETYINAIDTGVPQPLPIVWETFQDIITDAIQSALMGEMTPQEALNKAVKEIKAEDIAPIR